MKHSHTVPKTILLADDDDYVRILIRAILERAGYRVIEAVDGQDAVEKFVANQSDINFLVLDVMMPRKNGREVYKDILKLNPRIKALFVTGYAADMVLPADILAKPFRAEVLLSRMAGMLN